MSMKGFDSWRQMMYRQHAATCRRRKGVCVLGGGGVGAVSDAGTPQQLQIKNTQSPEYAIDAT